MVEKGGARSFGATIDFVYAVQKPSFVQGTRRRSNLSRHQVTPSWTAASLYTAVARACGSAWAQMSSRDQTRSSTSPGTSTPPSPLGVNQWRTNGSIHRLLLAVMGRVHPAILGPLFVERGVAFHGLKANRYRPMVSRHVRSTTGPPASRLPQDRKELLFCESTCFHLNLPAQLAEGIRLGQPPTFGGE